MLNKTADTWGSSASSCRPSTTTPSPPQPWRQPNNKIKTVWRRAYGFADRQCFILQIYTQHEKKYPSVG
ncbi:MAG: hypothetical protein AMK72_01620 [Planctomycetes bacterium SM23_25]|nr:MAG: hypothetical protein AMK72_01620 [Planctomycetes bacterium SM23_25]